MSLGSNDRGARVEVDAGTVTRRGEQLVVEAPDAMADRHWEKIKLRLSTYAAAGAGGDRSVLVPVDGAEDARRELAGSWPASRWTWSWTRSAEAAVESSATVQRDLRQALDVAAGAETIDALARRASAAGLRRDLLPEQAAAVSRLVQMRSGSNFSVPGSGKTTMTYAVFAHLRLAGLVDRLLVVAPLSAHQAWVDEARECFTKDALPRVVMQPARWSRSDQVIVINYERAAHTATPAAAHRWAQGHRVLVVFDEAHRAKRGKRGQHGAAAAQFAAFATCRLALTGTPMPNGETDLAVLQDLVWPGWGERLVSGDLKARAERTWVRVTKDQLGIEPMRLSTEVLPLDPAHRQVYDLIAGEVRALEASGLLDERPDLAIKAVMRVLAVASNPALALASDRSLSWDTDVTRAIDHIRTEAELRALVERARPSKLRRIVELADQHGHDGRKLLVWTNFLGNVAELGRLLAHHEPAIVTGATPVDDADAPTDRGRELGKFRGDSNCHLLIATPQTLGEGVSLHRTCQSQVHLDRTFNAGLYLQALDRTHRVGMPSGTRAHALALIAENTLDERVQEALTRKIREMLEVLTDPSLRALSLPDDNHEEGAPATESEAHTAAREL